MSLQFIDRTGRVHLNHAAMAEKVKLMTVADLRHVANDAREARDAMPDGRKAGYYTDELLACLGELCHRGHAT